jgi:hypothetical protein
MSVVIGATQRETIMRYLCLLAGDPDIAAPEPGSAEFLQMLDDYGTATTAMAESGVLVDSAPLDPPSNARSLRMRDGRPMVTDGPFIEIKEAIGGYYVLDCADMDEALRWAATIPAARYGVVEVRPVMTMGGQA